MITNYLENGSQSPETLNFMLVLPFFAERFDLSFLNQQVLGELVKTVRYSIVQIKTVLFVKRVK